MLNRRSRASGHRHRHGWPISNAPQPNGGWWICCIALDGGDWAAALLWFVEALKLDSGDDKWEPVHRARIAAILAAHPRLVDVRFHHEPVIAVELGPCGGILSADLGGEVQFGRLDSRIVNKFDLTLGDGILKSAQLANCDTRLLAHTMDNSFDHETGYATLWDTGSGSQLDWQRQDGSRFEQLQASDILLRGINALVVDTQTEIWSSWAGSQISGDVGLPGPSWFSGKLEVSGSGRFGAFLDITSTWIDEGSIEVWDLDMNAPVLTDLRGIAVAFDPLDRWMAVGSREGHVSLWDLQRRQPIEKQLFDYFNEETARSAMELGEAIRQLEFIEQDGWYALLAVGDAGGLQMWNIIDGSPLAGTGSAPSIHPDGFNDTALNRHGWQVATAGRNDRVRLWQFDPDPQNAGQSLLVLSHGIWYDQQSWSHQEGVLSVSYSVDGRHLLSGGADGTARLWLMDRLNPRAIETEPEDSVWRSSQALIEGGKGSFAITGTLRLEHLTGQKGFRGRAFSTDGRFVAATDSNGMVEVWNQESRQQLAAGLGPVEKHATAADLLHGSDRIVVADTHSASIWEMSKSRQVGSWMRHREIRRVLTSPDGNRIITVGEKDFRLWEASTGEPLTPMRQTAHNIVFVRFSDDGRWLLVAGREGGELLSAHTGQPVWLPVRWSSLAEQATLVAAPGKLQLLEKSTIGNLRMWDFSPTSRPLSELQSLARALSNRRIDAARSIVQLTSDEFEQAWRRLIQQTDVAK